MKQNWKLAYKFSQMFAFRLASNSHHHSAQKLSKIIFLFFLHSILSFRVMSRDFFHVIAFAFKNFVTMNKKNWIFLPDDSIRDWIYFSLQLRMRKKIHIWKYCAASYWFFLISLFPSCSSAFVHVLIWFVVF